MISQAPDLPIYVAKQTKDQYLITLTVAWSSVVSLIRVGYRITTNDGGEGLVTAIHDKDITVVTSTPFKQVSYAVGTWDLFVPTVSDITRLIPPLFSDSKIIPEIMETLQGQVNEVDDSVLRLNYSKDYNLVGSELLSPTLSDMGITLYQEVRENDLRRLVEDSVNYHIYAGRKESLDYLGLSFDFQFDVKQLWTRNYREFLSVDEIPQGTEKYFYPTNYVRLTYLEPQTLSEDSVRKMFYDLAWICNIVYDIVLEIVFKNEDTVLNTALLLEGFINCTNGDSTMQRIIDNTYSANSDAYPRLKPFS